MAKQKTQTEVYEGRYGVALRMALLRRGRCRRLRWRFDIGVRYRCRRLQEVLEELGLNVAGRSVLEIGFACGNLLASFPPSCALTGVEVSRLAVEAARSDPLFEGRRATFMAVREEVPGDIPPGPFDIALLSHVLEHVTDDVGLLAAIRDRLAPGGLLAVFVPIDEPHSIPHHRRRYSRESVTRRAVEGGFDVLFAEGGMHITGHVWKLLSLPNRLWPSWQPVADCIRMIALSPINYPTHRLIDRALERCGVAPTQYLLLCRKAVSGGGS